MTARKRASMGGVPLFHVGTPFYEQVDDLLDTLGQSIASVIVTGPLTSEQTPHARFAFETTERLRALFTDEARRNNQPAIKDRN